MENNALGMMQNMNINLPSPTQFDARHPQLYEWAGEVKAYLNVHNVNIEDIMDDCTKLVTVILLGDIQDKYTADEVREYNTKFPVALQGEDEYDEYMDMTVNIKKMRGDIINFSQTLNYVLLHATKPGSEAHSIIRRVMRQSNGFESWRQLQLHFAGGHRAQQFLLLRASMQPSWNSHTRQFTKQYYKWLEDINRYESENKQGTLNDYVKIATGEQYHGQHCAELDDEDQSTDDIRRGTIGGVNNYKEENYNDENYEEEYDEK
eukprot:6491937-Amphidinium_carterae.1